MRKRTHHRTAEQHKATTALVDVAGRFRVIADAEGWPVMKGRGFIEAEGSVGLWGVMSTGARSGQQPDKLLKDLRQLDVRVRLGSGLVGLHT